MARLLHLPGIDHFMAGLGTWEIDEDDVEHYRQDSVVVCVVVASVDGGRFSRLASDGTTRWTHRLSPLNVRVASGEMRDELVEVFHLAMPGDQLSFELPDQPATPPAAPPNVDPSTGEIDDLPDEAPDAGDVEPYLPPRIELPPRPVARTGNGSVVPPPPAGRDAGGVHDFFAATVPADALRSGT